MIKRIVWLFLECNIWMALIGISVVIFAEIFHVANLLLNIIVNKVPNRDYIDDEGFEKETFV